MPNSPNGGPEHAANVQSSCTLPICPGVLDRVASLFRRRAFRLRGAHCRPAPSAHGHLAHPPRRSARHRRGGAPPRRQHAQAVRRPRIGHINAHGRGDYGDYLLRQRRGPRLIRARRSRSSATARKGTRTRSTWRTPASPCASASAPSRASRRRRPRPRRRCRSRGGRVGRRARDSRARHAQPAIVRGRHRAAPPCRARC